MPSLRHPYRFGGDEFAVVMEQCDGHEAMTVARPLLAAVEIPAGDEQIWIGTSAGSSQAAVSKVA
jgi:GGDEF domain-containing protein